MVSMGFWWGFWRKGDATCLGGKQGGMIGTWQVNAEASYQEGADAGIAGIKQERSSLGGFGT